MDFTCSCPIRQMLLPQMIEKGKGVIIHIASIQGKLPLYNSTLPYAAAKVGLINYSKSLSKEVSPKGVRVLTVSPGWIMTTSAERTMKRIAESSNTKIEEATQSMMDAPGVLMADLLNPKKWQNWLGFWFCREPVT